MARTKILFLAANPQDTSQLKLDQEIRGIDQALQGAEFRDNFDIEQQWAVRVADLQNYLLRHKPDIVHFSGHGSVTSEIILEDNDGNSQTVSSRALSQLFSVLKDNIRCVVLNACYSAVQADAIAKHIDCVVGMSHTVGDEAAVSFASAFYQALGFGRNVKTAFELGCLQIDSESLNEQDTPKLIARNCDPKEVVFVREEKAESPAVEASGKIDRFSGTPREYAVLITIGTACLCLIILVLGTVLGVLNGSITVDTLGKVESAGVGGGLLGFGMILYRIIKISLAGGTGK